MNSKLTGLRVMVLEDETLVSMMLEDMLDDLGCRVVGPFMRVGQALAFLGGETAELDAAILDVNLAGENSSTVAEALCARNIPFVFATGYGSGSLEPRWRDRPALGKPFSSEDVARALESLEYTPSA